MEMELSDMLCSLENITHVLLQCPCMCASVPSLSHVQLFAAHQAPLSTGLPRQEHWLGLPFPPPPGDLPDTGMEPGSPELAGGFLTTEPAGKPAPAHIPCSRRVGNLYLPPAQTVSCQILTHGSRRLWQRWWLGTSRALVNMSQEILSSRNTWSGEGSV